MARSAGIARGSSVLYALTGVAAVLSLIAGSIAPSSKCPSVFGEPFWRWVYTEGAVAPPPDLVCDASPPLTGLTLIACVIAVVSLIVGIVLALRGRSGPERPIRHVRSRESSRHEAAVAITERDDRPGY